MTLGEKVKSDIVSSTIAGGTLCSNPNEADSLKGAREIDSTGEMWVPVLCHSTTVLPAI